MTALPVPNLTVRRAERSPAFLLLVALAFCLTVLPLAGLAVLALGGGTDDLAHLASTVLPGSILVTAQVMVLVALLTGSIGVVSAWLIVSFDFPMRKVLAWMLILPVAIVTTLVIHAGFYKLLKVPLPWGVLQPIAW